jgi:hypothetical protein
MDLTLWKRMPVSFRFGTFGCALAIEFYENWIAATRYLSMDMLQEHRNELLHKTLAA